MTTAKPTEADATTEVWTYAGIRVSNGKRAFLWIAPDGNELIFHKGRAVSIGSRYEARVYRYPDGDLSRFGHPVYLGEREASAEQVALWEAESNAAGVELARQTRERSDAKLSELDEAIEPLLAIARQMRNGHSRDALTAYVIRRMHTAW